MALKITDLRIDPNSLGETFLLADITPSYEYKDGEQTDKLDGYCYSVVLHSHQIEKLSIKIANKIPLVDIENSEEISIGTAIKFSNLEVGSYYSKIQGICITAKADSVDFIK